MCIEDIKKELMIHTNRISTFDEIDLLLFDIASGQKKNQYIIFKSSSLKSYFLNKVPEMVINCNSSYERFCEDLMSYDNKCIFNNLKNCNDINILQIILNTKNIMID